MFAVNKRTLQHYRIRGLLPYTFIDKKVYYKVDDLIKVLNKGLVEPKSN